MEPAWKTNGDDGRDSEGGRKIGVCAWCEDDIREGHDWLACEWCAGHVHQDCYGDHLRECPDKPTGIGERLQRTLTVLDMIKAQLRAGGYDGLYYEDRCGCGIDDLSPGDCMNLDCCAAYARTDTPPDGSEAASVWTPGLPGPPWYSPEKQPAEGEK